MMIDHKLWIQPLRFVIPIGCMLFFYCWAKSRESKSTDLVSPVMQARLSSAVVFLVFSIGFVPRSVFVAPDVFACAFTVLLCFTAFFVMKRYSQTHFSTVYPEVQARDWSATRLICNDISWLAYLFGYEVFFRGFLLSESLSSWSMSVSITINVVVYAISHLHKGYSEVFVSIPFGLLLCLLTIGSGSIWCAFALHAILALSNEWFSIYNKFFKGLNPGHQYGTK